MTGAGSATTLAFGKEQSFKGNLVDSDSDSNPDYWAFGRNPTIEELDLQRQLTRLRDATSAEAVESLAQNLEGAVSIQAVVSADVHNDVHDIVFNDNGTEFTPGRSASARVFTGINYMDGTTDRELIGCIPLDYTISYEEGDVVTYSLTMGYANEPGTPTSIDPANVTQVTDGSSVAGHGFSLSIDGGNVALLQSAELSISDIARYQWGAAPVAEDAVIANPTTELQTEAIYTGPSRTQLAYGAPGATGPQDTMDSVTGEVEIATSGGSVATYSLPNLKPDSHSWNAVIDAESDTTDDTTFHVNGGITVA
jgi:hypothetical protein